MSLKKYKYGFIGAGSMAAAIIKGLIASGSVNPANFAVSDINKAKLRAVGKDTGIRTASDNAELIKSSDVVVLAVKPQDIQPVLRELSTGLQKRHIVISIAAGVSLAALAKHIKHGHIVRAMPNLGCYVDKCATALSFSRGEAGKIKNLAKNLFGSIGIITEVTEKQMDIVTALSGCGPAYVAVFCQILVSSAAKAGLSRAKASKLFNQTLLASAFLLNKQSFKSEALVARVASKGGATEAALARFREMHLEEALGAGFKAALKRTKELTG